MSPHQVFWFWRRGSPEAGAHWVAWERGQFMDGEELTEALRKKDAEEKEREDGRRKRERWNLEATRARKEKNCQCGGCIPCIDRMLEFRKLSPYVPPRR